MKNVLRNFGIAFGIFALVFMVGTCQLNQPNKPEQIPIDSSFYKAYQDKVSELETSYHNQIKSLSDSKDSLKTIVKGNKRTIAVLRFQATQLESKITEQFQNSDSSMIPVDSIKAITYEYMAAYQETDSICRETIQTLELVSIKQDSIIRLKNSEIVNLKDVMKLNELREQRLSEELNTAYKVQRKAVLKSKLCAGAMILLSGFSGALLIKQTLK